MSRRPRNLSMAQAAKSASDDADKRAAQLFATDSFQNFALKLGIGTDNALSGSTYGYYPITRTRVMLEWIHRGSWLGGVAIDLVADDMVREGIEIVSTMPPEDMAALQKSMVVLNVWGKICDTIKWARLYGGAIAVMLVDGQDMSTPLDPDKVGPGQFKGLLVLDRWLLEPSLGDLVSDFGPDFGLPKYYTVSAAGMGVPRWKVHFSRCLRLEGIKLPHQQRISENMWGISILERIYDRLIMFDSASAGAAQLVHKSYLRTLKVEGLKNIAAFGGEALEGLVRYVDLMRRFQGIEGVTLIDASDDFGVTTHSAITGIAEALQQFGQQLSGALQIPLVRLFGQSPGGLNSSGDSDLRTYYDGINSAQERDLRMPLEKILRMAAASESIDIPDDFSFEFRPLWQMTDKERADTADVVAGAVSAVYGQGLISQRTALKELRSSSRETGLFTNITDKEIEEADEDLPEIPDPLAEQTSPMGAEAGQGATGGKPASVKAPLLKASSGAGGSGKTGDDDILNLREDKILRAVR